MYYNVVMDWEVINNNFAELAEWELYKGLQVSRLWNCAEPIFGWYCLRLLDNS